MASVPLNPVLTPEQEQLLTTPPATRICNSLFKMRQVAERLQHYNQQIEAEDLSADDKAELTKQLAKLERQIQRTLAEAEVVAGVVQS